MWFILHHTPHSSIATFLNNILNISWPTYPTVSFEITLSLCQYSAMISIRWPSGVNPRGIPSLRDVPKLSYSFIKTSLWPYVGRSNDMTPKCSIALNRPFVFGSRFVVRDVSSRCRFREIDGVLKYIVIRSVLHGCYDLIVVHFWSFLWRKQHRYQTQYQMSISCRQ